MSSIPLTIREVYPGSVAHPDSEYVELQMWAPGQNLVGGHQISFYGKSGSPGGNAAFSQDVTGGVNQSTLLAATPEAESEFGLAADASMAPGLLDPAGGAVCWESLDCASWGSFSGPTPSPTGSPASPGGIPDSMALRRTIEPGCATLLERGDDRDNSAADFAAVFPGPRPNSVSPSEHACSSQAAAGGGDAYPGSSPGGGAQKTTPDPDSPRPGPLDPRPHPDLPFRLQHRGLDLSVQAPGGAADSTAATYPSGSRESGSKPLLTSANQPVQSSSGSSNSCRSRKWRSAIAQKRSPSSSIPLASG